LVLKPYRAFWQAVTFNPPLVNSAFLKVLRTLRNAELPDTRPSDWFFGAKRLANQSFDRQIFLHNRR
jgi:hypothetical protein